MQSICGRPELHKITARAAFELYFRVISHYYLDNAFACHPQTRSKSSGCAVGRMSAKARQLQSRLAAHVTGGERAR
jgi:hypothetical protein